MKRWKNILGRGGAVLIAVSLALLLVSLIPQTQLGSSSGRMPVSPDAVYTLPYSRTLTPQERLQVKVNVEGAINIYLLELGNEAPFFTGMIFANTTELLEFLEKNQNLIIWDSELENENFERVYSPTKVTNATVVLYNSSSDQTLLEWEITLTSSVAPGDKVRNIAYWAAAIGILFIIPWLVEIWNHRKEV